jgi:poly(A) polymerase
MTAGRDHRPGQKDTGGTIASPTQLPQRLSDAPWLFRPDTQSVLGMINAAGEQARIVGGAVRNALMGEPVTDVDIATTASPPQVMALARKAGLRAVDTGAGHGTVTVIAQGTAFEITTLRSDEETFGRHARVAFTRDWHIDAGRRDFTMNALYADADGIVFDPLGGYGDVIARRVRFIGDPHRRIREDYLRILRFFRFSAEYGGDRPGLGAFDEAGLRACESAAGGLGRLSAERVRVELLRLLKARGAAATLEAMRDTGILARVLGGVVWLGALRRLVAVEQGLRVTPDAVVRLGVLGVRICEHADALRRRLRLGNDEHELLRLLGGHAPVLGGVDETGLRALHYRLGDQRFAALSLYAWAVDGAHPDDAHRRAIWERSRLWRRPDFPISGADLLALGHTPGPRLGDVLRQLEAEWIGSNFMLARARLLSRAGELASQQQPAPPQNDPS